MGSFKKNKFLFLTINQIKYNIGSCWYTFTLYYNYTNKLINFLSKIFYIIDVDILSIIINNHKKEKA